MSRGLLEFLVEPFAEGQPGPHVIAAIKAVEALGLHLEVGPFSSQARGGSEALVAAAAAVMREALNSGATRVSLQLSAGSVQPSPPPGLHGALARMIRDVETRFGAALPELSREEKQAAVRMLDDQGAFLLRRSIEDLAAAMGVSRITIYNYLNAIRERDGQIS